MSIAAIQFEKKLSSRNFHVTKVYRFIFSNWNSFLSYPILGYEIYVASISLFSKERGQARLCGIGINIVEYTESYHLFLFYTYLEITNLKHCHWMNFDAKIGTQGKLFYDQIWFGDIIFLLQLAPFLITNTQITKGRGDPLTWKFDWKKKMT